MDGIISDTCENVGEVGLRIDTVHFAALCRTPNYAERFRNARAGEFATGGRFNSPPEAGEFATPCRRHRALGEAEPSLTNNFIW